MDSERMLRGKLLGKKEIYFSYSSIDWFTQLRKYI